MIRRLDALLNQQGYTVRGVQQLLASEARGQLGPTAPVPVAGAPVDAASLKPILDLLARALLQG